MADPPGSTPLVAAVTWLEHTLLGTITTTVAVVAVAWVGMMMLTGRVNVRPGTTVIIGCFILFGASSIAAGIRAAATGSGDATDPTELAMAPSPPITIPTTAPNYDPYAGASVPHR